MRVAQAAFASTRSQQALARPHQVHRVRLTLDLGPHHGAGRYRDHKVFTVTPMFATRATRAATAGCKPLLILKLQECIQLWIDLEKNVATPATISTVGATPRHILFTPEC